MAGGHAPLARCLRAGPLQGPTRLSGQTAKYFLFRRKTAFLQKKGQAKRKRTRFPVLFNKMPLAVHEAALSAAAPGGRLIFQPLGDCGEGLGGHVPGSDSLGPALPASRVLCPSCCSLSLRPMARRLPPGPPPRPAQPRVPALDSLMGEVTQFEPL